MPGREWAAIVGLLLLAFALRTVALTQVPPGLHNDEVVDIRITETVADGRLAIFFPEDTGAEVLYYYFAAPFFLAFGKTAFAMRLPAVFISMVSMCVIWALARRLLGSAAALTALAGFALVFWTVAFGRIVLHVVMEVPLAALAAYCFWRAWSSRRRRRALTRWALSGLWTGLAINAYTAARVLPLIFLAFGLYVLLVQRSRWRHIWGGIAVALVVTAVVVSPLFVYLARHPDADQLDFFDIDRPLTELRRGNLLPVLRTSLRTLGMFAFVGDPLPYYDVPGRPIFEPVGALLLAAGLLIALWRWRQPRYGFIVLWFFISLLPGMLSQPAPNYTRTLGVQVVLFAVPGIAIAALLEWRKRGLGGLPSPEKPGFWLPIALGLLFVGNLAWTAHDYFVVWPSVGSVRFWHQAGLKAVADRLQVDADTSPVAICVPGHLIEERDPWWKPVWQHMRYLLRRPDLSLRYYNCLDAMVFVDGPARYAFPDVADVNELAQFPAYARVLSASDPATQDIDILPRRSGVILHVDEAETQSRVHAALERLLRTATAGSTVAWAPEVEADLPAQLPVSFEGRIEFLGYELSAPALEAGDTVDVVTYWRVTEDLPPGLSQFTHVLNADGAADANIVAQRDGLSLTSASLRPGDVFAQVHSLTLPGDLDGGAYPLAIGLYTPSDGTRLRITQAGRLRGNRLWLDAIEVGG